MKYSIRDLVFLILVYSVGLGWIVDHRLQSQRYLREREELLDQLSAQEVTAWNWESSAQGLAKFLQEQGYDVTLSESNYEILWKDKKE